MATERLQIIIDATFSGKAGIEQAGRELKKLDDTTRKANEGTRYMVQQYKDMASKVVGYAGAAAGGAALAWKTIGEGAELDAARKQFDNLAESIGTSGSALSSELASASRHMMTNAEAMAAASDLINTGLVKTKDEAVFLTEAVGRLGLNMNQLTMTLLNDSTMRLDALKLSAERVKEIQDGLKASGATGDLFDQAVFIALQEKMDLLGDSADYAAGGMERVANRTIDAKNALLEFVAVRSGPAFTGLANYFDAVDQAQSDMNDAVRLGIITQEEANTIVALAKRGYDEWQDKLRETREEIQKLQPELQELTELEAALAYAAENSVSTYDDIIETGKRAERMRQMETWGLIRQEEAQRAANDAWSHGAEAFRELLDANRQADALADAYTRRLKQQHDAAIEAAAAQEMLFTSNFQSNLDRYTNATWGANVNQEALNDTIIAAGLEYEASTQKMAGLYLATGEYDEATIKAAISTASMQAEAQKLTQDYVDGTITLGEFRTEMENLMTGSPYSATFELEASEARQTLRDIVSELNSLDGRHTRSTHTIVTVREDGGKGGGDKPDGGSTPPPSSPGSPSAPGAPSAPSAPDPGDYGQYATGTGGWLTVPPGFPNDSYKIGLTSGEPFAVLPPGSTPPKMGGGAITITIPNATFIGTPIQQAKQMATMVAEELGRI